MNNQHKSGKRELEGKPAGSERYRQIKLGLDVHAETIVVVRILENSTPQPAQSFTPEKFLAWAKSQLAQASEVHSCYEAGPFGYVLHRQLVALGIRNVVVQPVCLDERHTGVNHDKSDALALAQRLDRYVAGNARALALVRVPSPEEEQRRVLSRQREQLQRQIQRMAAQGLVVGPALGVAQGPVARLVGGTAGMLPAAPDEPEEGVGRPEHPIDRRRTRPAPQRHGRPDPGDD
jgi:transposase